MHRFIIRAIDPVLGCSALETMLAVEDLEALRLVLGVVALDDAVSLAIYTLDPGEAEEVIERFGLETYGCQACPIARAAGATLRLMMCWPRPAADELDQWIETSKAAAIVHFGGSRDLLQHREREEINGTLC